MNFQKELTCPCGDYEFFLEYNSKKKLSLFCPFCGADFDDEQNLNNNDDFDDE